MAPTASRGLLLIVLFCGCLAFSPSVCAQTSGRSEVECRKQLPRNWGPNFGVQWRQHEATYWGCRLGVPGESIKEWRNIADVSGAIQNILIEEMDKEEFVFIEQVEGSLRCFSFSALKKTAKGWEQVWSEASDDFCVATCPPIEMKFVGSSLVLMSIKSADPQCSRLSRRTRYSWTGKTFERVAINK
jgi:hypothetical protein